MVFLNLFLLLFNLSHAGAASICGSTDDRYLNHDLRIGRISSDGPYKCTVTMISKNCALTAGHCVPLLKYVEFNVPVSIDSNPQSSKPEDIYFPDPSFLIFKNQSVAGDWAVLKLRKNNITERFPGDNYNFYPVYFTKPALNEAISFSGYGSDLLDGIKHYSLKKHEGKIYSFEGNPNIFYHNIDSTSGDSGSAIVRQLDQSIVGIHFGSGCSANYESDGHLNRATLISAHEDLQMAITKCLRD